MMPSPLSIIIKLSLEDCEALEAMAADCGICACDDAEAHRGERNHG